MPSILLLTAADLAHEDVETPLVAGALADMGLETSIVAWTAGQLADWAGDLVVIRTTWDYTTRLPEFLGVLASLPAPVRNDIDVVRWNSHKGYLVELAAAGVPVVPTTLLRGADLDQAAIQVPDLGSPEIVVKPAVSAGARGTGRFPTGSAEATAHLRAVLSQGDALVQPFQPEVAAGERSVIFIGGRYSHAVLKTPAVGEYRVQERLGGVNTAHSATASELDAAEAALAAVPGGASRLLYARVDLIGSPRSPLVMELELIEPELFLPLDSASATAFARAAAALL
jgi:glutathione synthase/RimK-type ligase-like ATP-grasp enzyme